MRCVPFASFCVSSIVIFCEEEEKGGGSCGGVRANSALFEFDACVDLFKVFGAYKYRILNRGENFN